MFQDGHQGLRPTGSQTLLRHKLSKNRKPTSTSASLIFSYALSFRVLVGLGGLEPPTSPLSGVRSNHLSYRPKISGSRVGGASRDRTDDPLLAKQVLSQLSYGPKQAWVTDTAPLRDALNAGALCGCLTGQSVIL